MAETCIVCLGDLVTTANRCKSPRADRFRAPDTGQDGRDPTTPRIEDDCEAVAHILPCGHNLHNDCLRPWVERANSCPICRASFNMVELCSYLNGPPLSSYAVEDKQQVAEIDAAMIIEDDLEDILNERNNDPCLICEDGRDEDLLLICDGCEGCYHTYCCDLDSVPAGAWYCPFCHDDGINRVHRRPVRGRQRNTAQRQRLRGRSDHSPSEWARVWQSVFHRTNLDLDFPFEEDEENTEQTEAQRREFNEWQRRFQVAERQGGAARFRDTATSLLDARHGRLRSTTPATESQEEIRAWNAFEKAKELQNGTDSGSRKRKSATASPSEPEPSAQPERKLKRPRTRRVQDVAEQQSESESSKTPQSRTTNAPTTRSSQLPATNGTGPSFLQSLLKEVETAPANSGSSRQSVDKLSIVLPLRSDTSLPGSPSPGTSPTSSISPSPRPRSASPQPRQGSRPSSPSPLSSRIEPDFSRQQPQFSPVSPAPKRPVKVTQVALQKQSDFRTAKQNSSPPIPEPEHSRPRTDAAARDMMSLSDKTEIQNLVKTLLKPLYRKKEISSEQYTDINRQVSRQMYERIGQDGGLVDGELDRWKLVAATDVEHAVKGLKTG